MSKRKKRIRKIIKHSTNEEEYYNDFYNGELVEKLKTKYLYEVWAKRPNVAVSLWKIDEEEIQAYGFSKVNWPDCWELDRGIEIALAKAAAQMVRV